MSDTASAVYAIPYEILRRDDGVVALSCNAGLLIKAPGGLWLHPDSVTVTDTDLQPMALLRGMPVKDLVALERQQQVFFIEALRSGIFSEKLIPVLGSRDPF